MLTRCAPRRRPRAARALPAPRGVGPAPSNRMARPIVSGRRRSVGGDAACRERQFKTVAIRTARAPHRPRGAAWPSHSGQVQSHANRLDRRRAARLDGRYDPTLAWSRPMRASRRGEEFMRRSNGFWRTVMLVGGVLLVERWLPYASGAPTESVISVKEIHVLGPSGAPVLRLGSSPDGAVIEMLTSDGKPSLTLAASHRGGRVAILSESGAR